MRSFFTFVILFSLISVPAGFGRQLLDRVAAVVNDEIITESELDAYLRPVYEQLQAEPQPRAVVEEKLYEMRGQLLNQLIEDRLVYQIAAAQELQVDPAEIEREIERMRRQVPPGNHFDELMEEQGLSMKDLREKIRRQIMIHRLHDQEVRAKIVVSPSEVENYYQEHTKDFADEEKIQFRSFTVRKSPEAQEKGLTDEEAMNRIKSYRDRILAGEDFGGLAREHSEDTRAKDGGDGGWVGRGEMNPEIDGAIFGIETGKMTDIIESPMGYHFFLVTERQIAKQRTFDEVRNEVQAILYRQKFEERFNQWMQELKRAAYISVR